MYCIVGLGNPGESYALTRHNAGRRIVESMHSGPWKSDKQAQALLADSTEGGVSIMYVLPETFMNLSGNTVRYICEKRNIDPAHVIIIHDEVDLPLGSWKISKGRGDGGHNGIKSIASQCELGSMVRIRVGISPTSLFTGAMKRPPSGGPLEKYVLGRFSSRELRKLDALLPDIRDAVALIVTKGANAAMNKFN